MFGNSKNKQYDHKVNPGTIVSKEYDRSVSQNYANTALVVQIHLDPIEKKIREADTRKSIKNWGDSQNNCVRIKKE